MYMKVNYLFAVSTDFIR